MKKVLITGLMLFFTVAANAESFFNNTILGVAFINQNVDLTVSNASQSATASDSGSGFGIYLDKYYKSKYRFNGTVSYITYNSFDIAQVMLSADYLFPLNPQISLFAGGAAGGALQKYSDASITDSAMGIVYGVQFGGIAYINKHLMLELGYRLRPTNIETEIESSPGTSTTIDDLSETYFSILLMF